MLHFINDIYEDHMMADIYTLQGEKSEAGIFPSYHYWRFKRYKKILVKLVHKKDKFLDIGCQEGILLSNLPDCKKYGIEIDEKFIKLAKKRNPGAEFKIGPMEKLPYKDQFFDCISCTEVIEHIDNPEQGLREISRVLKKNGFLLLSTYNHYEIFNILTRRAFIHKVTFYNHLREYNWFSIKKEISKYFEILMRTQAGSNVVTDAIFSRNNIPLGEFMIILCRKK